MTQSLNKKELQEKRRFHRSNMPKAEAVVWSYIKNKQILGQRFLRQYSVNNFIMDFYCPRLKFGIEIDGDSHYKDDKAAIYDYNRAEIISSFGIELVRYTNLDVLNNIDGVIKDLFNEIEKRINPPAPLL